MASRITDSVHRSLDEDRRSSLTKTKPLGARAVDNASVLRSPDRLVKLAYFVPYSSRIAMIKRFKDPWVKTPDHWIMPPSGGPRIQPRYGPIDDPAARQLQAFYIIHFFNALCNFLFSVVHQTVAPSIGCQ